MAPRPALRVARIQAVGGRFAVALVIGVLCSWFPHRDTASVSVAAKNPPATDAFSVPEPPSPWKRVEPLDPPGRLSWGWAAKDGGTGLLRISLESAPQEGATQPSAPQARAGQPSAFGRVAVFDLLELEERRIATEVLDRLQYEMTSVERDSFSAGGRTWWGFRTAIRGTNARGDVYRYATLHPDPGRSRNGARMILISYEEIWPGSARSTSYFQDVRRLAEGLASRGTGMEGGIESAYIDARAATFAARIDSTARLCWTQRNGAIASQSRLGWGGELAPGGDFFQFSASVPSDSLVDAGTSDYGVAFDRNRDGRYDLLVINQGIRPIRAGGMEAIVAVVADDDFDGRVDGSVFEDADLDGDGRVDHRVALRDTNRDGVPDRAWAFTDAMGQPAKQKLALEGGRLRVVRLGEGPESDVTRTWSAWSALIKELSETSRRCGLAARRD